MELKQVKLTHAFRADKKRVDLGEPTHIVSPWRS